MKRMLTFLLIIIAVVVAIYFLFIKKEPPAYKRLHKAPGYILNVSFKENDVYKIIVDLESPRHENNSQKDDHENELPQRLVINVDTKILECISNENVRDRNTHDQIAYDIWFEKFKTSIGIDQEPAQWMITAKKGVVSVMQETCLENLDVS